MDDDSKRGGVEDAPARDALDDRIDATSASGGENEAPQVFNIARPGNRRSFFQTLTGSAAVGATVVAGVGSSCNEPKTPTGPTGGGSTSTSTSTSTTTSVATTTALNTFTIAGVVTDRLRNQPVVGARVFVVDGPNANKSSNTDGNGYYSIPGIIPGSFTLRTTLNGVFLNDLGITVASDTRRDFQVSTTTTTSTSTTSTAQPTTTTTSGNCICDLVHYWYPN
jgi:hypothetical protein